MCSLFPGQNMLLLPFCHFPLFESFQIVVFTCFVLNWINSKPIIWDSSVIKVQYLYDSTFKMAYKHHKKMNSM